MKAIILAGGTGTRLRPVTAGVPKPMAKLFGKPILEHTIALLKQNGITEIGLTLRHMPEVIEAYFQDGAAFGVHLTYFRENTPLGTAGSVKAAQHFLDDEVLVINGDVYTDLDLKSLIAFKTDKQAEAVLALKTVDIPLDYGVVITAKDGRVEKFVEKPDWNEAYSDAVNTGVYVLSKSVIDDIPKGELYDFARDVFPKLLEENRRVFARTFDCCWHDIGDLDGYKKCFFDLLDAGKIPASSATELAKKIFVEPGAHISPGARLGSPCYISAGCKIEPGAYVGSFSYVGADTRICQNAAVKGSVLQKDCFVGRDTKIEGSVICKNVKIGENVRISDGCAIGQDTVVHDGVTVKPGIKIWDRKFIKKGTAINSNIVSGYGHSNRIFGYKGIVGEINVDITVEFATRLGASFGSLKKGGSVAVACDGSAAGNMLKSAIAAGLVSTGALVHDMGEQPLPITRKGIARHKLWGGVHVSIISVGGMRRVKLDFLDEKGFNINRRAERELEKIFAGENFYRAEAVDIREITDLFSFKIEYLKNIIFSARHKPLGCKVAVATAADWAQRLITSAGVDLGFWPTISKNELDLADTFALNAFCKDVQTNFDLGAIIDRTCEKLVLIDENGRVVSDDYYLAITAMITAERAPGEPICAETDAPSVLDDIAKACGTHVIRGAHPSTDLQFCFQFDAVGALISILDYMKAHNCSLSALVAQVPEFHVLRREVDCAAEKKTKVMKQLLQQNHGKELETEQGIKIKDCGGWVFIVPDSLRPVYKIVVQGYNEETARELTDFYEAALTNIIDKTE